MKEFFWFTTRGDVSHRARRRTLATLVRGREAHGALSVPAVCAGRLGRRTHGLAILWRPIVAGIARRNQRLVSLPACAVTLHGNGIQQGQRGALGLFQCESQAIRIDCGHGGDIQRQGDHVVMALRRTSGAEGNSLVGGIQHSAHPCQRLAGGFGGSAKKFRKSGRIALHRLEQPQFRHRVVLPPLGHGSPGYPEIPSQISVRVEPQTFAQVLFGNRFAHGMHTLRPLSVHVKPPKRPDC